MNQTVKDGLNNPSRSGMMKITRLLNINKKPDESMIDEEAIQLRRQILNWRDKHYENIYSHLSNQLPNLYRKIDVPLNELKLSDAFRSEVFFKKRIEPIYHHWVNQECDNLINIAQQELNQIMQHAIERNIDKRRLYFRDNNSSVKDVAKASLSTTAAIAAIPAVISASTTSVSAGGLLGLLGVTTTVISWPVVLVGGTVVLVLSHFGLGKAGNLKADAKNRISLSAQEIIKKRVIYNKEKNSVCQLLQQRISGVSNALLQDFIK